MGLMPVAVQQFLNVDGTLLAGGFLYSYAAGTTTPQATYTDATLGTPNANPVVLNTYGQAAVWLGTNSYKFVLKDSLGNTLWTADQVQNIVPGSITSAMLASGAVESSNIAAGAVGSVQIATGGVASSNIAPGAVGSTQIAAGGVAISNLSGATQILFQDTSDGLFGGGPRGFPMVPWAAPTPIAQPGTIPTNALNAVKWSPNGQFLLCANNTSGFATMYQRYANVLNNLTSAIKPPILGGVGYTWGVAWSPNGQYIALAMNSSPYFTISQRQGTAWAPLNFPAVPPAFSGAALGVAWSPNGEFVAFATLSSPYVKVLQRSFAYPSNVVARYGSANGQSIVGGTTQIVNFETVGTDNMGAVTIGAGWEFTAPRTGGYRLSARLTFLNATWALNQIITLTINLGGTPYSIIDTLILGGAVTTGTISVGGSDWMFLTAGAQVSVTVKSGHSTLALTSDLTANFISIIEDPDYNELPVFTALSNPGTLPGVGGTCCAWTFDSQFLAVGSVLTPFIQTYQMVGTTITGLSAPVTLPNGQVNGCAWSPDGTFCALAVNVAPYIQIYTAVAGVLTLASYAGVTAPAGAAAAVAWSPNGALLAVAFAGSPYILIYAWNGTTFTTLANPGTLPPGNCTGLDFICDGKYLAVACSTTPYVVVYETSGFVPGNAVTYIGEDYLV